MSAPTREEWIELFPYGLSVGTTQSRPVLIFRDKNEHLNLPVWMNLAEGSLAAFEAGQMGLNIHSVAQRLLDAAQMKIERCEFTEMVGHHQYVVMHISGHPNITTLRMRADEALPFCLIMKTRFYSTKSFIMRCRDVDFELLGLEQSIVSDPKISTKKHPYVM